MPQYSLKSRHRAPPNGLVAFDAGTNCQPPPFSDFEAQCRLWQQARMANPGLARRYRLSTGMDVIRQEVDAQLAQKCHDLGLVDFYQAVNRPPGEGVDFVPFHRPASERIAGVAKAAAVSMEWIASGEEAVPIELAERRARTCVACPMNEQGDWLSTFTIPFASAIKKALELRTRMSLKTSLDDELGVCTACDCVCKLKVHMPIERILEKIPIEVFNALHEACWIRSERTPATS